MWAIPFGLIWFMWTQNISVRSKIWLRSEISDLPHVNAALASSVDSYFTPTIDQRLNLRCSSGDIMSEYLASYRRMFSLTIIMFATIQHSTQAAQFWTIQKFMCLLSKHYIQTFKETDKEWFYVWNIPCWHSLRYRALEDQNYVMILWFGL